MQRTANPSTPVRFRPQPPGNKMKNVNKAIIPVAGLGTRMLPATKAIPKELLPIIDKPLIQYVVDEAISGGIKEIILVTRSGKEAIENHFDLNYELEHRLESKGNGRMLKSIKNLIPKEITISSVRQESAIGLGNAILCAKHLINGESFAVLLPDEILLSRNKKVDDFKKMVEIYKDTNLGQILVEKINKRDSHKYGIIKSLNKNFKFNSSIEIEGLVEKPSFNMAPSNYRVVGRYILPADIMSVLEKETPDKSGEIQLTSALDKFLKKDKGSLNAFLSDSKIFDCGSKIGFLSANIAFALENKELKKHIKRLI